MENVLMGLSTTGLGMLVVFLGLIFLMYIMLGLAGISKTGAKRPAAKAEKPGSSPTAVTIETVEKADALVVDNETPVASKTSTADEEIAAIAAVMAILTSEGVQGTVTAVRPIGPKFNLWALAGRRDIMASRL